MSYASFHQPVASTSHAVHTEQQQQVQQGKPSTVHAAVLNVQQQPHGQRPRRRIKAARLYANPKDHRRASTLLQPDKIYAAPPRHLPTFTVDGYDITIHASDGHKDCWPAVTYHDGPERAWHQPADARLDKYNNWRSRCGHDLAEYLGLKRGRSGDNPPEPWRLTGWPKGYKMFQFRTKENANDPLGDVQYTYVAGSTFLERRRFKTSKEFAKHLAWLCKLRDNPTLRCACKHCQVKFGRDKSDRSYVTVLIEPTKSPTANDDKKPSPDRFAPHPTSKQAPGTAAPPPSSKQAPSIGAPRSSAPRGANTSSFQSRIPPTLPPLLAALLPAPFSPAKHVPQAQRPAHSAPLATANEFLSSFFRPGTGDPTRPPSQPSTSSKTSRQPSSHTGKRKREAVVERSADASALDVTIADATAEAQIRSRPKRKAAPTDLTWKEADYAPEPNVIHERRKRGPKVQEYTGPYIKKQRVEELSHYRQPFREDELVWYTLPKPIIDEMDPTAPRITHWPALIDHRILIAAADAQQVQQSEVEGDGAPRAVLETNSSYQYLLILLGLSSEVMVDNTSVCPWLLSPFHLILLHKYAQPPSSRTPPEITLESLTSMRRAITPWKLAVQQGQQISDNFTCAAKFYSTENKHVLRPSKGGIASPLYRRRKKETERARQTASQLFQCLWWGPERIWAGEIVRLAGTWDATAEGVAQLALRFKESGKKSKSKDGPAHSPVPFEGARVSIEARDKPAFFRIDRIERDFRTREVTISGQPFELVDSDGREKRRRRQPTQETVEKVTLQDTDVIRDYYAAKYAFPAPSGKAFQPLRQPDGQECDAYTLPVSTIAGRYYPKNSFWTDDEDAELRRIAAALCGKRYRSEAVSKPFEWTLNRNTIIEHAGEDAEDNIVTEIASRQHHHKPSRPRSSVPSIDKENNGYLTSDRPDDERDRDGDHVGDTIHVTTVTQHRN